MDEELLAQIREITTRAEGRLQELIASGKLSATNRKKAERELARWQAFKATEQAKKERK